MPREAFPFGANVAKKRTRKPRAKKPRKSAGGGTKSNAWRAYVGSGGGWASVPD
jgi:hypothetical protein